MEILPKLIYLFLSKLILLCFFFPKNQQVNPKIYMKVKGSDITKIILEN